MIKTIAIVVLVLLGLYVFFGSIHKRRLLISKGIIVLAVLAVLAIGFSNSSFGKHILPNQPEQQYQKTLPSIANAPYLVTTPSRAYYVASCHEEGQYLVLTDFYFYDLKRWEFSEVPLYLDRSLLDYEGIKVIRRYQ